MPQTRKELPPTTHLHPRVIAIICSLGVGMVLMGVKFYAYHLTDSSAILSDALESIINVVASAFALWSVLLSAKPADRDHPYGHGKIEYFSAGFEGALIILAAVGIFKTGLTRLLSPQPILELDQGLMFLAGASIINLALGLGLIRVGRRTESLTVVADGHHVLTDVYTSAGVLLGLLVVRWSGWLWLDGAIACLMGLNIVVTGTSLVRRAAEGLMDASDEAAIQRITLLISKHKGEYWIGVHQLRAWRSGPWRHVDLHLILPRDLSLQEAHCEAKALERAIIMEFQGRASVLIHTDPCEDPQCPVCSRHQCDHRQQAKERDGEWSQEDLIRQDDGTPLP